VKVDLIVNDDKVDPEILLIWRYCQSGDPAIRRSGDPAIR
jgi:hypothetical protein